MPSKLFQKRKRDAARREQRAAKDRSTQVRILLVSEGSKTEPNYLVEFFRLDGGSVVEPHATRDHVTSPTQLLQQARDILNKDRDFDLAFVVGDRDEFGDFDQAVNAAATIQSTPRIKYIYSDPCFELWLLLHFRFWDAPIDRHSLCDEVKKFIHGYEKGCVTIARDIYNQTDDAIANSISLRRSMEGTGGTCPTTLMDVLISDVRSAMADRLAD